MDQVNLDTSQTAINPSLEQDTDAYRYFNRDLSWLSFNLRVLLEAKDRNLPLYERLKFMAIYSSNLDEFFRVRVASIQSVLRIKQKKLKKLGLEPDTVLDAIYQEVNRQQEKFGEIFREDILPDLESHGIILLRTPPQESLQLDYIRDIFFEQILPFLHVELLMKNKILHFLRDQALYLVVKLRKKKPENFADDSTSKSKAKYALIQIPTHYFSRFVQLPQIDGKHYVMFLDDVIRFNLDIVFPGYIVEASHSIKLSRNADLLIEDEFNGDLVAKIRKSLLKRRVGAPARFLYDKSMPKGMIKYLLATFSLDSTDSNLPEHFVRSFRLDKSEMIAGGRYHNFMDFFSFPNPLSPKLEQPPFKQLNYDPFDDETSIFQAIKEKDHMLHFPYQSYEYVLRFLSEAALDPHVEEIYTTQYRVASDSAIVNTLINAARNNKNVTVFVEIKARFDEATNLETAEEMKQAGVKVIYSLPGLKVHAKVALVMRREQDQIKRYAFLSTGNFNEKTARIYADHGLFTSDDIITGELRQVFQYLEDETPPDPFQQLLVAQFNLRQQFESFIEREIQHAKEGKPGYILIKINNFEDKQMIDKIYEASKAGVKIDLIVRSICCIRPGLEELSENVTIRRIVGRFLEHARVFVFYHLGAYNMYLGSSDWMERNLKRRIEVVFPIKDELLKSEIMHILKLQLTDNVKAVTLDQDMNNIFVPHDDQNPICAQEDTYKLIESGNLGMDENLFPKL